jgi:hypothetical protein
VCQAGASSGLFGTGIGSDRSALYSCTAQCCSKLAARCTLTGPHLRGRRWCGSRSLWLEPWPPQLPAKRSPHSCRPLHGADQASHATSHVIERRMQCPAPLGPQRSPAIWSAVSSQPSIWHEQLHRRKEHCYSKHWSVSTGVGLTHGVKMLLLISQSTQQGGCVGTRLLMIASAPRWFWTFAVKIAPNFAFNAASKCDRGCQVNPSGGVPVACCVRAHSS